VRQHGVLEAEGYGRGGQAQAAVAHRGGCGWKPSRVRRAPEPVAAAGERESDHVSIPGEGDKGKFFFDPGSGGKHRTVSRVLAGAGSYVARSKV